MYKNQLQELAQRSCFNLPSYTCLREGPDHAPRFKAAVNFNGEVFESPNYCTTLRQAEHSAAEVALNALATHGPSHSLAARVLDETGVYKNLLQEISQRVGAPLPMYMTFRSGLGHLPVFTGTVELADIVFTGEPAKTKKQAEKNAAMAAWSSLKQLAKETASYSSEPENPDELEQITLARALLNYRLKEKVALANSPTGTMPFAKRYSVQSPRPSSPQPQHLPASKILPLICPKVASRIRPSPASPSGSPLPPPIPQSTLDGRNIRPQKFPAVGAIPYVPIQRFGPPCRGVAPPVTIRTVAPVFAAPRNPSPVRLPPPVAIAPPICVRQAVPVFAAPLPIKEDPSPVLNGSPSVIPSVPSIAFTAAVRVEPEHAPLPTKQADNAEVPTRVAIPLQ
ncbi:hypothetical protein MLD38_008301 [Melastoma candidum]|uniref:Uncharacterized protein n=1 Tax=Melastoma candidum TaxID=119954 RepID=A0ACB9RXL5_9MYRT|nr:hypothetical protein MLD38_008301 [Melastoma candidum]